jgi:hypothetical protein
MAMIHFFYKDTLHGYRCSTILPHPHSAVSDVPNRTLMYSIKGLTRHLLLPQFVCSTMGLSSLGSGVTMRSLLSSSRFSRFSCFSCFLVGIRTDHQFWPKMLDLIAA